MPKFDFTEEDIAKWHDEAYLLEGTNNVGFVLVHGWSAMPRQVRHIAELLNEQGYWVKVPRLKGHGTYPEDLENAKAADWVRDSSEAVEELKKKEEIKYLIVAGVSLGGNLALLATLKTQVDGLILIGTPAYLKKHFLCWWIVQIGSMLKKYVKKKYPKGVALNMMETSSYQYFPIASAQEAFTVIRKFIRGLSKTTIPTLIFQISGDYMIGKRSPWIIYKSIKSKYKKINWMTSTKNSHVPLEGELDDFLVATSLFIADIKNKV